MSTSPSWFDQEKFSRLVKKVGPKTTTEVLPSVLGSEPEHRPGESLASTARISLVSKPPSLLSDQRALPALPRRTSPLPNIKALFPTAPPPLPSSSPAQPAAKDELSEPLRVQEGNESPGPEEGELAEIWHKMGMLNEELARTVLERDQALNEGAILRDQLRRAHEANEVNKEEKNDSSSVSEEELARLTKERDAAVAEGQGLRVQMLQAKDAARAKEQAAAAETQEISIVTGERDQARREYAELRKQYETLKQEQAPKEETVKFRKEWEQQIEELKGKIEDRDEEIAALKASASTVGDGDEKLKREAISLREQLAKAKDEASVAQRGLALSQKALQQTRDTLREATEGTSLSRHNFDNLKNECAILAQQNTVLQSQVDSLSRDLNTTKSKTARLQH